MTPYLHFKEKKGIYKWNNLKTFYLTVQDPEQASKPACNLQIQFKHITFWDSMKTNGKLNILGKLNCFISTYT